MSESSADLIALELRLVNRFERERKARKEAERLLEEKSIELYNSNLQLRALADNLEKIVMERTQQLENALSEAQRATAAKSNFLATMSHEIRTPMNGVLGMADILLDMPLNDDQYHYVQVIKNCSQTLLSIINDILDFSKIEAGKLELEYIPLSLRAMVGELFNLFQAQARDKNIEIFYQIDPRLPEFVVGDPTRLRQIFFNLLSNAIKFTDKGFVHIQLQLYENAGHIKGIISDSGIGISKSAQEKLFTPFSQADSNISRQYGGTGLGLAICARLIGLMAGKIWVESEPNKGSIFSFTFRAPACEEKAAAQQARPESKKSFSHLRMLLVEDNLINQKVATKLLEKIDIKPMLAKDGLEALSLIEQNIYDIILMDMQMPNMDGLTATQHIRAKTNIHQPIIIALTANAFSEDQQACQAVGMEGFLSKPIVFEKLFETISFYESKLNIW